MMLSCAPRTGSALSKVTSSVIGAVASTHSATPPRLRSVSILSPIGISSWFDSPHDQQLLLMLPWLHRLSREDDVLPLLNDMRQVMDSGDGTLQSTLDLSYADGSP